MSFLIALAVAAAVLTVGGSLLARSISPRFGAIAHPRHDRWNAAPVPLLGGPAIAVGVALTLPFIPGLPFHIWVLLGGAIALTLVGLVDDLQPLRPHTKLTAQFVVAGAVIALGLRFPFTGTPLADVLITMVWMVGLTNAFNLLDNMDGLAAGVAAIAGVVKLSLFAMDGNWPGAAACAAFVGACVGFLAFNFHPARLFMGDAGSMFLGFFIAGLSTVGGSPDSRAIVSVLIAPVAVMLVPIFDTSFVTVMRLLARRPISRGGQDHLSHRLVKAGLSPRLAVLTLYALAAIAGFIGFTTRGAGLRLGLVLLAGLAVATFILGVTLARIRIYPDVGAAPAGGVPLQRAPGLSYLRQVATVGIDGVLVILSYYTVYNTSYAPGDFSDTQVLQSLPIVFSCKMAALALFRGHVRMWRYTNTHDLLALVQASTVGSVLAVLAILFLHTLAGYSRAVFALDWALFSVLLASSRLMLRGLSEMLRPGADAGTRVLIYGAGNGGVALLEKLRRNSELGRVVVGFLDDDGLKQRTRVHGLPVFGGITALPGVLPRRNIEEVIISTTRLSPERVAQVRAACEAAAVPVSRAYIRIERLPRATESSTSAEANSRTEKPHALQVRRYAALAILPALGWLVAISAPYGQSAIHPMSAAFVAQPLLALMALVTLSGWLCALRKPKLCTLYCYGLLGITAAAVAVILIGGRVAGAVAAIVWLTALGWASGQRLLRRLFGDTAGPRGTGRAVFAIALAFGVGSHLVLGLALLAALDRWPIVLFLVCLSGVLRRDLLHLARVLPQLVRKAAAFCGRDGDAWYLLPLVTLLAAWFLFIFVQAVAPETQYDALVYHLALPQLYIEHGGLITTPYLFQSWFYLGAEMNYLLAMLIGGHVAAKLVHFVFLLLTVGAIAHLGRQAFGWRAGLFAAVLYASTPLVVWEASTAYVDLAQACYCLLAITATHAWMRRRGVAWLWLAGLMTGFAISVKVSALWLGLPLGMVIVAVALLDTGHRWTRRALPALAFSGGVVIACWPWPLLRWAQTGNPVFPFYDGLFKGSAWTAGAIVSAGSRGSDPGDLLRLPWALTFHSERFYEGLPGGVIGLSLLVLPLLVLCRPFSRLAALLLTLLVPFSLFWVYFGHQGLRLALPALPLVCLLAGYALNGLRRFAPHAGLASALARRVPAALLVLWVSVNLPLTLPLFWNIPERLPLRVALGRESPPAYLARIIPSYNAYRAIERRHVGERVHILGVFEEFRLYAPGTVEPLWSTLLGVLPPLWNEDQALPALRQHGVTHILINRSPLPNSVRSFFLVQPQFLERYGDLEYEGRGIEAYRLRYPPAATRGPASPR